MRMVEYSVLLVAVVVAILIGVDFLHSAITEVFNNLLVGLGG